MMILMHNLGNEFVVWDRAAEIQFKRPGQTKVFARFEITPAEIESLANEAKEKKTIKPVFRVDVVDEQNKTVARVLRQSTSNMLATALVTLVKHVLIS